MGPLTKSPAARTRHSRGQRVAKGAGKRSREDGSRRDAAPASGGRRRAAVIQGQGQRAVGRMVRYWSSGDTRTMHCGLSHPVPKGLSS